MEVEASFSGLKFGLLLLVGSLTLPCPFRTPLDIPLAILTEPEQTPPLQLGTLPLTLLHLPWSIVASFSSLVPSFDFCHPGLNSALFFFHALLLLIFAHLHLVHDFPFLSSLPIVPLNGLLVISTSLVVLLTCSANPHSLFSTPYFV